MRLYNINDIVASTVQNAITSTSAIHLMTSTGSTLQYGLTGFTMCNSIAASGFMDVLGNSDYPPLYRISLPGNCVPAEADFTEAPIPLGENQNVRLKTAVNLNVTGTLRFAKIKVS